MNFDYTSITLFGFQLFEPMVSVTNILMLLLTIYIFRQLKKFKHPYPGNMSTFMLIMGISSIFGATAHGIHHQFGIFIFDIIVYISNALSLISAYFCFMGTYFYQARGKLSTHKLVSRVGIIWIILMLIVTLIVNTFVIVKAHAGVILIYSLIVHLNSYFKYKERGSGIVSLGIFVSFFSFLVHSLHFSLHEYFNYKDIAHVIMIISLAIIYKGIRMNSEKLAAVQ